MDPVSESRPPISGFLSNGGVKRYLLEAESTTGFVAWKTADGTVLINPATEVSLPASPNLTFWPCADFKDTTPAGRITFLDCHGNDLTRLDVRALNGLEYLDCSFNSLTQLVLDGLTELQGLDVDNNALTSLNVRCLQALRVLNCANNRLTALNIAGLNLQVLDYSGNPMDTPKTTLGR
jgi:Leucine-rich repeat (LRR) protein